MTRRTAAALAALALLAGACTASGRPAPRPSRSLVSIATDDCPGDEALLPRPAGSGNRLPDVTLRCLGSDREVPMRRLRGPAVVNLWASWCGPCVKEMPAIQQVYSELKDRVVFLGVDTADGEADARELIRHTGIRYPSVFDREGVVRRALRIIGMPGTAFVDERGTIVFVHLGELTAADLRAAVRRHLGVSA